MHSSTRRHCVFSEGTEETAELIPKAQRLPEISDSSPNFVTAGAKADQRSAAGRGASGTQTGRFKIQDGHRTALFGYRWHFAGFVRSEVMQLALARRTWLENLPRQGVLV